MKIVFFSYDFMMDTLERLVADGHEIMAIVSFECDNIFNFNTRIQAYGVQNDIPVILDKITAAHIGDFIGKGAECFLAAGYPYKIPPIDENKAYGVNFHPSMLPKGRGLMPTPYIIMQDPGASGMTLHKLAEEFDKGDILHQEPLPVRKDEDVETLSARIAMHAPQLISEVMSKLSYYWKNAEQQREMDASHWPPPDETMRSFDWEKTVEDIDKTGRAFGRYGALARFDDLLWVVYDYKAWKEDHEFEPGEIACRLSRQIIIAAKDGFVCLKEFHELQAT